MHFVGSGPQAAHQKLINPAHDAKQGLSICLGTHSPDQGTCSAGPMAKLPFELRTAPLAASTEQEAHGRVAQQCCQPCLRLRQAILLGLTDYHISAQLHHCRTSHARSLGTLPNLRVLHSKQMVRVINRHMCTHNESRIGAEQTDTCMPPARPVRALASAGPQNMAEQLAPHAAGLAAAAAWGEARDSCSAIPSSASRLCSAVSCELSTSPPAGGSDELRAYSTSLELREAAMRERASARRADTQALSNLGWAAPVGTRQSQALHLS